MRPLGRRALLKGALGSVALGLAGSRLGRAEVAPAKTATYFVPGYAPDRAYHRGRPVREDPALTAAVPRDWQGALSLLTRVDEGDGSVRRALFPVAGHEITISPDGQHGVFNSLNDGHCVAFSPETLESRGIHSHGEGFIGAGHAFYLPEGGPLVIAERREWRAYTGKPEDHHGRITLRDPETFALLEAFDCRGMAPHEIGLTADGRHVAVANYGKTLWPDGTWRDGLLHRVAPSLTVIELASGRLVHEVRNPDPRHEVRHLAAHSLSRVFAISARMESFGEGQKSMRDWEEGVYEADVYSGGEEIGYLPSPLLRYELTEGPSRATESFTEDPLFMRYGQSIVYDPAHDEVIATYPTRHAVVVFSGEDGAVRRVLRTDRLGLRQPRGVVLHPDGRHYVVSGWWQGARAFSRGEHAPVSRLDRHEVWFGHSHLAVAAA